MKIYVDETFIDDRTIFSAIKISDEKIKEAIHKIKNINNWQIKKMIKATDIRMKSNSSAIRATVKILNKRSKWAKTKIITGTQHSQNFYIAYGKFLSELKLSCPSAEIIVDNFNGIHKIMNFESYTFMKSSESEGLQLADIFLVDKRK